MFAPVGRPRPPRRRTLNARIQNGLITGIYDRVTCRSNFKPSVKEDQGKTKANPVPDRSRHQNHASARVSKLLGRCKVPPSRMDDRINLRTKSALELCDGESGPKTEVVEWITYYATHDRIHTARRPKPTERETVRIRMRSI